jgi:GntR family transcriptional regulator, transcriptional repressor for pyruvate dehydrogenase complex
MKINTKKSENGVAPVKNFLTPVTRTTLTADVCREMVSHLIRGDWSVGERIPPERELCQQLGVGRASLREALKALEIMGMIETRLGDGTYVCHRSEFLSRPLLWAITGSALSEAHELVEARCLIEMGTAGFAADRATGEDLKEIGDYLDRMEGSLNDVTAFEEADIGFHLAVAQAAHNQILHNALLLIRNLMQKWIDEALRQPGVAAQALDQHKQIFLGIAKRNPERAKAAMHQHLDAMARYLQEKQDEAAVSVDTAPAVEE